MKMTMTFPCSGRPDAAGRARAQRGEQLLCIPLLGRRIEGAMALHEARAV